MVKLIVGEKGQGKTKKLIALTNEATENSEGQVVFIDDDDRYMLDVHRLARFVGTNEFDMSNYKEFVGFIYGILSQNNDITEIYIDGLKNIIKNLSVEDLEKLVTKLEELAEPRNLDFTISVSVKEESLSPELKERVIN